MSRPFGSPLIKNDRIRSPPLSTLVSCPGRCIVKQIVPPTSDCSRFLLHCGTPWTCGAAVLSIGRNGIVQVETFDHIIIGGGVRSEERRVGKGGVSTCRSRGAP